MRNIKKALIIPALFLVGTLLSFHGTKADVVATVEIYKAKVESQDGNKLKISFDVFNERNIQPGIRYSVELDRKVDEESSTFIDQKVYPEILTLGPGERVHREVEYDIPKGLNGQFEVWVVSDSENGMPLGQGHAGDVTISRSANSLVVLTDSCNVKIDGEDKTYDLYYGVDSASSEKLILSCKVKSEFSTEISATPSFETFLRNTYGDKISSAKQEAIRIAAGEEKTVNLVIPKAEKPQAYDAVLVFLGSDNQEISNKITAHYVVQGESASIRTINFDKNAYLKGDMAKVFFRWVGSADSFSGSRKGEIENAYILEITVKDGASGVCSDVHRENIGPDTLRNMNLDIQINKDCPTPVSLAVLKDEKGNILDSQEYSLSSQSSTETPGKKGGDEEEKETGGFSTSQIIFGIIAFLTALSLALIVYSRLKAKKIGMNIFIILAIAGSLVFFGTVNKASARTISVDTQETKKCKQKYNIRNSDAEYVVGLDDDTYNIGDEMKLSSRVTKKAECSNGDTRWRVRAKFDDTWHSSNYSSDGDIGLVSSYDSGKPTSKSKERTVKRNPNGEPGGAPGRHFVSFVGSVYDPDGYDSGSLRDRCEAFKNGVRDDESIEYSVRNPKRVNITVNGPGNVDGGGSRSITVNEGDRFTLHAYPNSGAIFVGWSGICSGTGTCSGTMGQSDLNVTATFNEQHILWVGVGPNSGTENNRVTSINVGGINCTSPNGGTTGCNSRYNPGQLIRLRATPGPNYYGGVWGNNCAGTSGDTCTLTMGGSDLTATINYTIKPNLRVTINGCGTIQSPPLGWSCSSSGGSKTCPDLRAYNTNVPLTTSPCPDSHFGSWGGACSGSGGCNVNMGSSDQNVIAFFASQSNCSCDTNDCKSTCIGQTCNDSCGNPTCKGTLSCPLWQEVQP